MSKYTISRELKVWNDETGDFVSIGEDDDGLGLVDIKQFDGANLVARISLTVENARVLSEALRAYLNGEEVRND